MEERGDVQENVDEENSQINSKENIVKSPVKKNKTKRYVIIGVVIILIIASGILGFILIENILSPACCVIPFNNPDILKEIDGLFPEENISIMLGAHKTIKVKDNEEISNVVFVAKTINGSNDTSEMRYILSLDNSSKGNCLEILGKGKTESFFNKRFGDKQEFSESSLEGRVSDILSLVVPKGTQECNQEVHIFVYDGNEPIGLRTFTLRII